ncbi:MAG: HXXEE domain-containing protein [Lachnospiraceae bacterium]|nr:HXXEE domain-containing protein [Lachnospiraceae bacterium]
MQEYLLLLPIIFIIHDMEEIIGFGWFFEKNPDLFERFPKVMNTYRGFTYMGFAAAVYEEFIPFFGVSLLAYYFPGKVLYGLWYGIFLALVGHFFIHIGHTIHIRKYIPCFITSVISLPVSTVILFNCAKQMTFDITTVVCIVIGIIGMIVNFPIAHGVMHFVNKRAKA